MAEVADLVAPDAKDLGITMPEDLSKPGPPGTVEAVEAVFSLSCEDLDGRHRT